MVLSLPLRTVCPLSKTPPLEDSSSAEQVGAEKACSQGGTSVIPEL